MPQQHRAQVTRRAIVVAAAEEFVRHGYAGTTLGRILRRSGVTKGAFYFHFPTKRALAQPLVDEYAQACSRARQQWVDRQTDPLSTVVGLTAEVARALDADVVVRAGMQLVCAVDRVPVEAAGRHDSQCCDRSLRTTDMGVSTSGSECGGGVDEHAGVRGRWKHSWCVDHDDWSDVVSDLLRSSVERGQLRADAEPSILARVVCSVLLGPWACRADSAGCAERVAETWRGLLTGVTRVGSAPV